MNHLKKMFFTLNEGWRRLIILLFIVEILCFLFQIISEFRLFCFDHNWDDQLNMSVYSFNLGKLILNSTIIAFFLCLYWVLIYIILWIREGFKKNKSS